MISRFVSFHNGNIPDDVLRAQKAVFDLFEIPLEQTLTDLQHPDAIDDWLRRNKWDVVTIFDIDCIPLSINPILEGIFQRKGFLFGAEQHASHIANSKDYVSPAFMVLHKQIYRNLGEPSFAATEKCDVGGMLTIRADQRGVPVLMLPVSHVEKPMWQLEDGRYFGIGTTYDNSIYHAFESRMNENARKKFILKCQDVLIHQPAHAPRF